MVAAEVLVDRPAAAKTFCEIVPKANAFFAQSPAKENFLAAIERWEVQQSDLKIFYLAAG